MARADWARDKREERALWFSANRPHGPITAQAISVLLKNYLRGCGIKAGRAHVWRHSCATHLLQNRANLRHVQEILGHRSLATTERYLHLTITELKEAHRRFHPREKAGCEGGPK